MGEIFNDTADTVSPPSDIDLLVWQQQLKKFMISPKLLIISLSIYRENEQIW